MNKETIVIVILIIALGVVGYLTYDLYSKGMQCKDGIELLQAGLGQCQAGVTACQEILAGLAQVPECAPYLLGQ